MTRWNWIDDLVLPLAVAVLSAAWTWLWAAWSARTAAPAAGAVPVLSPVLLAVVVLLGVAVTRWALAVAESLRTARAIVLAAGLIAVVGAAWLTYRFTGPGAFLWALADFGQTVSPVLVGLLACAFLWWQGIVAGRSHLPQQLLERVFFGGVVMLATIFGVNHLQPAITGSEATAALIAFFGTGLGALALVSFENARRYQESVTGTWLALNRYWLGTVASVVGAILIAGFVSAALLSPESFSRLGQIARALLDVITYALVLVVGVLAFVIGWLLLPVMEFLFRRAGQPFEFPAVPAPQELAEESVEVFARHVWLDSLRQVLALAFGVAVFALLVWWAVRRLSASPRRDGDELRETIATRELLWSQLRQLFRRPPRPAARAAPYLDLNGPGDDPRLIARRAYQAMLAWAQALSLPRPADQTPAAYAETLAQAVPTGREAIATLTGVYEQARYAAEAPSLEEARRAEGAIGELRKGPAGSDQ